MKDREYRCSECLQLQKEEMESPYVCEGCEGKKYNKESQIGICNRTNSPVYPSEVKGYVGYCLELDEDLYSFEFTKLEVSNEARD